MNCALAIERTYRGEEGVFVGLFRAPEQQTLAQLQQSVEWYKNETLEKVGFYRMALRFGHVPTADPAAALVEHAERLGLQALQAVRHLRPVELRRARRRAGASDLAADDDAHLWPDRPGDAAGGRQADLRSPRAGRRLRRPPAPRHRGDPERPDPGGAARRPGHDGRRPGRGRFPRSSRC